MREGSPFQRRDPLVAALLYTGLTLLLTWPLARGLTHDLPADFGDPLFASWAIAWDATHLGPRLVECEHLPPAPAVARLFGAFPRAGVCRSCRSTPRRSNPILCYNLLFLSTFILSGLGAFLLGRELTGSRAAGFVAGLAYAFAPYRFASVPHLQVLSAAWMPFVLFGLRRYFVDAGASRPLAGAAAAWIAQNLSCGYYLLFFSPIVVLYIAWEIIARRPVDRRADPADVAAACGAVALATVPFLLPYLELRRLGFSPRSMAETIRFSADTYAYLTADPNLRLVGPLMREWPKAEGSLFPGFTIAVLAAIGGYAAWRAARRGASALAPRARMLAWLLAASMTLLVALLFGWTVRLPVLKITSITRLGSRRHRSRRCVARHFSGCARNSPALDVVAGWHLRGADALRGDDVVRPPGACEGPGDSGAGSLLVLLRLRARIRRRPSPGAFRHDRRAGSRDVGGVRYPRARRRWRPQCAIVLVAAMIVAEAWIVPLPVNDNWTTYRQAGLAPLPGTLVLDATGRDLYRAVANLPATAAVAELPLGEPAFDVRYMFYSTTHWRRLVNGYSGGEPAAYTFLARAWRTS